MADPKGFLTVRRELPKRRPVDVRIKSWSEQFSVIMPRDYRRAMDAQRMAEANGTDVDVAVMEAARG